MPVTNKRITLSERAITAFVAILVAAVTAGIVQAGSIMFGVGGWIPLPWLGYFVAFMALVGFLVGPVQIAEIFGFLWGTETTLSNKAQLAILTIIVGVIWVTLYFSYFR
jgi:hypothetical protein